MRDDAVLKALEVFVPLAGLLDIDEERKRLMNRIENEETRLNGVLKKLANRNFVERAPKEVVARERERRAEIEEQIAKLRASLEDLGDS